MVIHGVELSIGSASGWNEAYIEVLDGFHRQRPFVWHSEHLGFLLAESPDGKTFSTGVPLPVPFTNAALDLIVPRASAPVRRYDVPFLLENSVYYLPDLPAEGRDEVAFLNDLVDARAAAYCSIFSISTPMPSTTASVHGTPSTACGWTAWSKFTWPAAPATMGFCSTRIARLFLNRCGVCSKQSFPAVPNLAGIVFELLDEAFDNVGIEATIHQLERVEQIWNHSHSAQESALACH